MNSPFKFISCIECANMVLCYQFIILFLQVIHTYPYVYRATSHIHVVLLVIAILIQSHCTLLPVFVVELPVK